MTCTTKRATKGGEFGANGEWYEGGKFINTVAENRKKEGSTKGKARKMQFAPYQWGFAPEGKSFAIFTMVGAQAQWIDRYNPELGICPNAAGVAYYGDEFHGVKVAELCDRFNAGERWM